VAFRDERIFYEFCNSNIINDLFLCCKAVKRLLDPAWNVWHSSIVCVELVLFKRLPNTPMPDKRVFRRY
jgi:hypothetical protein